MSSDYRPRGGSGSGSGGGSGGRRRRGGRGRGGPGGHGSHSEPRAHSNGTASHAAPKKKESFISKLLGIFTGKNKKKTEPKFVARPASTRPDFKEREPRAERSERPERPKREERPPKADPTPQEIVSPKLYIGNLSYEAAESDLFDLFSKVGAVKNVEIAMDRHANRSKGFGFVELEELQTVKAAAEKLNRTDFMGRQIVVSGAKVDKRPVQSPREADPTSHEVDAPSHEAEPTSHEEKADSTPDSTI